MKGCLLWPLRLLLVLFLLCLLGGAWLYELPQRLGLAATRLRPTDLNLYPHPFQ